MNLIVFEYNYIFLFSVLFLFTLIYILVKRLIVWGIDKKMYRLFSYILGSLLFLHLFFLLLVFSNQLNRADELLPFFLQLIGIFGVLILIGSGIHYVWKKI